MRKPVFGLLTWTDTNRAVPSQKMARGLKFCFKEVEKLYYRCSENKCAADLRLCFSISKKSVFSGRGSCFISGVP